MNRSIISIIISTVFLTLSCAGIAERVSEIAETTTSRSEVAKKTLVVYFYQPVINPKDISFIIKNVEIKSRSGEWINLSSKPLSIRSVDIQKDQILLVESLLEEENYVGLRLQVGDSFLSREGKHFNLEPPQPDGWVEVDLDLSLKNRLGIALILNWYPNKSISSGNLFEPFLSVETQKLSPRSVLLYVTNSGSNYISVIDRFENRVVAIIGVEKNPTGMALSLNEERLYVLNSGSNSISIIDTAQDFVRDRIQLISGIEPIEMAMMPDSANPSDGKLYITNQGSNNISVVDTRLKAQIASISVRNHPIGIAANPDRQEVYVANSGSNSISVIDTLTDTVKATINVDSKPLDILVVNDSLFVLNADVNRITVVDIVLKKIVRTISTVKNIRKAIFSEQFNRVYLANNGTGEVSFLIPSSGAITRSIAVGVKPIGLAIDETRNRLYVTGNNSNKVAVINPVSEMVEAMIAVGKNPYEIVFIK